MQLVDNVGTENLTRVSQPISGWSSKRADVKNRSAVGPDNKRGKDGIVMANQKTKKCAHIPCLCHVSDGEEYCGLACRDAGSEDVEIACQCDHQACPLTFRQFATRSAADLAS